MIKEIEVLLEKHKEDRSIAVRIRARVLHVIKFIDDFAQIGENA